MRDDLFRVHVPERGWGYIDISGTIVIEPQFDEARDFSDGFARVSSQIQFTNQGQNYYPLWGYINTSGEKVIEERFSEAYEFSEGLACVKYGDISYGNYGYIDTNGNDVDIVPAGYDRATSFHEERAFIHRPAAGAYNEAWIMIDIEGTWLTDMADDGWGGWFDITTGNGSKVYWSNDLTPVRLSDGTGYVYLNKNGQRVLPKTGTAYADALDFTSDGLAVVQDARTMKAGYIDLDGNWAIPPQYMQPGSFRKGLAFVIIDQNQTAIIDTSGNCLLSLDGRAIVNSQSLRTPERILVNMFSSDGTGTYENPGYYSINDGLVIDRIFDAANDFTADYSYAKVQYGGLWGLIDKDGNWLIPAQFLALGA